MRPARTDIPYQMSSGTRVFEFPHAKIQQSLLAFPGIVRQAKSKGC